MPPRASLPLLWIAVAAAALSACSAAQPPADQSSGQEPAAEEPAAETPEWFDIEMTDVATGETFTMNDFAGQVVLLETMAIWCPNCIVQQSEIRKLHESLGNPDDFVSISLDVDLHETEDSLKEYVEEWGYDWRFAVSPRQVSHDLGNLYSAQYLNPPLAPMMIIDRDGSVEHLEYGIKKLDTLLEAVGPYFE
jgi:cytochrome oxidase Cu insertion factor (SCO1/SenC/PrrC family)